MTTASAPKDKKPGNIGHFVQSKAAVFDSEQSTLRASLVDESRQREMKLVDLNVLKKGANYHAAHLSSLPEFPSDDDLTDKDMGSGAKKTSSRHNASTSHH